MGPVYIGSVLHCVKIQMDPAFGWKKIWRDAFFLENLASGCLQVDLTL